MKESLDLRIKRPLRAVPESDWGWKSEAAVLSSMIATSGLQEKTIAIEAEIDPSTLAKVKQGTARPSEDHLERIMDATGSEAWIVYWLLKRGWDPRSLRRLESDTERRAREAEQRVAELERDKRVLVEALHGRAA